MIIEKLCKLMIDIDRNKSSNFSGLGLIIYSDINGLPVAPLKLPEQLSQMPINDYEQLLSLLLEISTTNHYYHDGFHLCSGTFSLTHLSQYFATPIVPSANTEYDYGSRYRTAFYGSFLKNVLACSVISNSHGPVVFLKGNKIDPYNT